MWWHLRDITFALMAPRVEENGKGVWKEAGCQQGVDGLTRRTSFTKLECAPGASFHRSRRPFTQSSELPRERPRRPAASDL